MLTFNIEIEKIELKQDLRSNLILVISILRLVYRNLILIRKSGIFTGFYQCKSHKIKLQLPLSPQVEQYRSKYALLRILDFHHSELLPLEGVIYIYDKLPFYT